MIRRNSHREPQPVTRSRVPVTNDCPADTKHRRCVRERDRLSRRPSGATVGVLSGVALVVLHGCASGGEIDGVASKGAAGDHAGGVGGHAISGGGSGAVGSSMGGTGGSPGDSGGVIDGGYDSSGGTDAADAGTQKPDADTPLPVPELASLDVLCKLISDRNLEDPTANDTHHRFNLVGTDLGIPVRHGGDLFLFFGDTAGYKGIWPLGPESLPDAVGYSSVPAQTVATSPELLCDGLRFLALDPAGSLGPGVDPAVQRDFAVASMAPPPGHAISEFIHNPAGPRGANAFPSFPGDFEVPSGAFSHAGSIYVFYTTVQLEPFGMRGSYLARWASPSTDGLPTYDILYHVDQRFDSNGPMRGNFINIAALAQGNYVYLFGSGDYRNSDVYLARKRLSTLDTEGGFETFDASSRTWVAANAPAAPIIESGGVGEASVQYFSQVGRYVITTQEPAPGGNFIMARFAEHVEGPWSAPVAVAQMEDPQFRTDHCCIDNDCSGKRLINCDAAGFYAPYMMPDAILNPDGSFKVTFTMSTWNPYNVALMQATFR